MGNPAKSIHTPPPAWREYFREVFRNINRLSNSLCSECRSRVFVAPVCPEQREGQFAGYRFVLVSRTFGSDIKSSREANIFALPLPQHVFESTFESWRREWIISFEHCLQFRKLRVSFSFAITERSHGQLQGCKRAAVRNSTKGKSPLASGAPGVIPADRLDRFASRAAVHRRRPTASGSAAGCSSTGTAIECRFGRIIAAPHAGLSRLCGLRGGGQSCAHALRPQRLHRGA